MNLLKKWAFATAICAFAINAQAQSTKLSKKDMEARILALEQETTTLKTNLEATKVALDATKAELLASKAETDAAKNRISQMETAMRRLAPQKEAPKVVENGKAGVPTVAETSIKTIDLEKTTAMTFEKTTHEFGNIKEGESVTTTFKFKNTGDFPLTITNARGSCGCTVPKYPTEAIAPGATGEIQVQFNSAGKQGSQQKSVTLTANTNPVETMLIIKAEVAKKAE